MKSPHKYPRLAKPPIFDDGAALLLSLAAVVFIGTLSICWILGAVFRPH